MSDMKVPSVQGDNPICLSEEIRDELFDKIIKSSNNNAKCEWCGENDWCLNEVVFTDTLFSIPQNAHIKNKVSPYIAIQCRICGNRKHFSLHHFGYTTIGGVKK